MSDTSTLFTKLNETVITLRGENGCPWDKRQTTNSLVKYLKSEFDELIEGISADDHVNICEELGDLLFLIIMISRIHEEQESFTIDEVLETVTAKLVRRHPHVFGDVKIKSEEELRAQWQKIKDAEKSKK